MNITARLAKRSLVIKGTHGGGFFHVFIARKWREWLRSYRSGPLDWPGERYWVLGPLAIYHYPRPIRDDT